MDAVEFIRGRERMCRTFNMRCRGCEIADRMDGNELCNDYIKRCPTEAVAIVEKWSKDHPKKTRQSEFLKLFPRALRDLNGVPRLCPQEVDLSFPCPSIVENNPCANCRKKYWLEEVRDGVN